MSRLANLSLGGLAEERPPTSEGSPPPQTEQGIPKGCPKGRPPIEAAKDPLSLSLGFRVLGLRV